MPTYENPAPTRGSTPSTASEREVKHTLPSHNTDADTEMLDVCGKNPLSHVRGDSAGDDSQPPRKRTSPNNRDNALPHPDRSSNHQPTTNRAPSSTTRASAGQHTEPQPQPPRHNLPPLPNDAPCQPHDTHHQQAQPNPPHQQPAAQQHPVPQLHPPNPEPQQPPPGFTSAEEREEMRLFAGEWTQTLARQAAARSSSNSDELKITPVPEQGFYRPEGLLSRWTINNVKAAQVTTIISQPGVSVNIHIKGKTSHNSNHAPHLAAGFARELKRTLPLKTPQVVPSIPATPPNKIYRCPLCILRPRPPLANEVFILASNVIPNQSAVA